MAVPFVFKRLLARSGLGRFVPGLRRLACESGCQLGRYSDRALAAPFADLAEIARLSETHAADVIDLACAEPGFDLVPSRSTRLGTSSRGLPTAAGLLELRSAIADRFERAHGTSVDAHDEVLITPGISGAFSIALDTFVNPGDRVVLFDPGAPLHAMMLEQRRARLHWLPTWMEEGRTRFHLDSFIKSLRGTKLLVVCSPASPTGGVLSPADLEQIAWWSERRDVLLFCDDAYARFVHDPVAGLLTTPDHLAGFAKATPRLLTAGGFSKGYGLTAARVGYLAGGKQLVRPCATTALLQASLVPTLSQQLALAALEEDEAGFEPHRRTYRARRDYVCDRLLAMGLTPEWPRGGCFVWVEIGQLGCSGRAFAESLYRSEKVLVWPGEHFGPSGEGHIRISYTCDDGRLREGLGRLARFLSATPRRTTPTNRRAA